MTYSEQLRHPLWQRARLKVLEDAGWRCEGCGDAQATLNVHHKRYVSGRMAWDYPRGELSCLCDACHQKAHAFEDVMKEVAALLPLGHRVKLVTMLVGAVGEDMKCERLCVLADGLKAAFPDWFEAGRVASALVSLPVTTATALQRLADELGESGGELDSKARAAAVDLIGRLGRKGLE